MCKRVARLRINRNPYISVIQKYAENVLFSKNYRLVYFVHTRTTNCAQCARAAGAFVRSATSKPDESVTPGRLGMFDGDKLADGSLPASGRSGNGSSHCIRTAVIVDAPSSVK